MKIVKYSVILLFIAVVILFLSTTCKVDEGYHHFVNAEEPEKFQVTVSTAPGSCGGSNIQITVAALNSDDSINTDYKRSVEFTLISTDDLECSFKPEKSPPFTEGQVTLSDIKIEGTPSGSYQLQADDENYDDITGISDEFSIGTTKIDHFEITGVPANAYSGDSFWITVTPVDENDATFPGFDGNIDLGIYSATGSFTISPEQMEGPGQVYVTINGTGDFIIYATLSADQPEDVTCLGGLEDGEGMDDGGDGGGDGGGGGDGIPDGGDGSGGSSEEPPPEPVPTNVTCNSLTVNPSTILKGESFYIQLSVSITDQNNDPYFHFPGGKVDFSLTGDLSGLQYDGETPTGIDILSTSPTLYNFTITNGAGTGTITASITEIDGNTSVSCNSCCSDDITVMQGIGIFGEQADYLKSEFENVWGGTKTFLKVDSLEDSLEPYTALIVNLPGSNWDDGNGPGLNNEEVDAVETYYSGADGRPVFIAHDSMTLYAIERFGTFMGITGMTRIEVGSAGSFILNTSSHGYSTGLSATNFTEERVDGFSSWGGSTEVVTTTYLGPTYGLIFSNTNGDGTKAVLSTEAIYHHYGSENSPETQWWDSSENNKSIIINLINWLTE